MRPDALHQPWFYCANLAPGPVQPPPEELNHIFNARRRSVGDEIALFDGRGTVARARVEHVPTGKRKSDQSPPDALQVTELLKVERPAASLSLLTAASKGNRLDWLVEKATELGTTAITLVAFTRSVVKPGPHHIEKLTRTAVEACKQARRPWLPELSLAASLDQALPTSPGLAVADAAPASRPLPAWLTSQTTREISVIVGPEGGLTPVEMALITRRGGTPVRLSPHILRTETAAISVAAIWSARTLAAAPPRA